MTKKRMMFVDDEKFILEAMRRMLHCKEDEWDFVMMEDPQAALAEVRENPCDVLTTDVKMPGMNGLELLEQLREDEITKDLPVVIVTGLNDYNLKIRALSEGACDLLEKPVDRVQLVTRLENALRSKEHQDELKTLNETLIDEINEQSRELARTRLSMICRLSAAAEFRDEDTGKHVIRVARYAQIIAAALGMSREEQEMLLLAAPLHDIGKIGVPDKILRKRGVLTPGEWSVMQRHCEIGSLILSGQGSGLSPMLEWFNAVCPAPTATDPLSDMAASIALCHHEKWNGGGYPRGLSGEQIPLTARIVSVADAFDAMTSWRPYRDPCDVGTALDIIRTESGRQFDPKVVEAMEQAFPEIAAIKERFCDRPSGLFVGEEGA